MTGHRLALLADIRHRRRLPQVAANGRSQGEEHVRWIAAPADKTIIVAEIEAERQRIRPRQPGVEQAVQLKVAERAVDAYSRVATDATTTLIVPSHMGELASLIGSAMALVKQNKA